MANYYNVTGWKRTGFDIKNRPFKREVLEGEYFTSPSNYFQMKGIAINREDMQGITWIRLPGSVKDIIGDQVNPPNSIGEHGPGGPFYSWEEVDYIRLVRTGYPGDVDFVDISGNQSDPWNAPHEGGKLFIAYYFVVGLKPAARSDTILFLMMDEWLSLGGADELQIESGFKVRGHITESEDSSTFNMSAESIGLIEPLTTISNGYLNAENVSETYNVAVSAIDLAQYDQVESIDGFVAQAGSGQSVVFPAIAAVSQNTILQNVVPTEQGDQTRQIIVSDYGFFDIDNPIIKHNLSILYSAGQIELQDSYSVPKQYGTMVTDGRGAYTGIQNSVFTHESPVNMDVGDYPRKADYMFGQLVLYSLSSGSVNIQPFCEISDPRVNVWAVLTPSGSPVARFKGIKGHSYEYDQTVSGITWIKKAIVMQGASGSMWAQINSNLNAAEINRQRGMANIEYSLSDKQYKLAKAELKADEVGTAVGTAASLLSAENWLSGASQTLGMLQRDVNRFFKEIDIEQKRNAELQGRKFRDMGYDLQGARNSVALSRSLLRSPYVEFVPDLNAAMFQPNGFGVQVVNTGQTDRKRLKDYFKRYGYSGLYKVLSYNEINVKQKVNYIECQDVLIRHEYYPMRVTMGAAAVLSDGVFFWNQKPDQSAFDDNPDN